MSDGLYYNIGQAESFGFVMQKNTNSVSTQRHGDVLQRVRGDRRSIIDPVVEDFGNDFVRITAYRRGGNDPVYNDVLHGIYTNSHRRKIQLA